MSKDNNKNNENNKIRRKKVSSTDTSSSKKRKASTPKKKDRFKALRVTGVAILAILVLVSGLGAGMIFSSLKDVEPVTKALLDEKTYETTSVLYSNGELMFKAANSNKKDPIDFEDMPQYLKDAVVAIEDERFYEHNGVDIMGLVRSVIKTLLGDTQGGSTLPMQVSKMLLTSSEKTIPRKIKDIYYAYEMSKNLSKEEILEVYLNNFDVGRSTYGVKAAAHNFFDKEVDELTLAECAMLAGATKHPHKLSPYVSGKLEGDESKKDLEQKILLLPKVDSLDAATDVELDMIDKLKEWNLVDSEQYSQLVEGTIVVRKAVSNPNAKERQELVLYKMLELGYITQDEHDKAVEEEIDIKVPKSTDPITSSVEDYITIEVIESLKDYGYTEPEAKSLFYNGGLTIKTTIDKNMQAAMDEEYDNTNNFPGDKLGPNGIRQPQSGMVIIDHKTGHIKSLIGGRNIKDKMALNRADYPQQPGSTIKPLSVYTAAIDTRELTQSTSLSDIPGDYKFNYGSWNPGTTTPGKEDMSLRKAMAYSSNPIAIRTAELLGNNADECYDIMIDYLNNFGITSVVDNISERNDRSMASLTLGGMVNGISPLEMASAYGTLANGGIYIEPTVFETIQMHDGKILLTSSPEENRVVDENVAYVLTDMLKAVVYEGIGGSAKLTNSNGIPVAGKTGTTNQALEVWFAGYTPYYSAAVYIGDDRGVVNPETGEKIMPRSVEGGSKVAAKLWSKIMSKVHSGLEAREFSRPDGVYFATINLKDGGSTSPGGYNAASAAFLNGTAPSIRTFEPTDPNEEEEEEEVEEPEVEEPEVEEPEIEEPEIETPDPETPDPETPDPETPDPETPDPETPDPETPDPEIPDPEITDPEDE